MPQELPQIAYEKPAEEKVVFWNQNHTAYVKWKSNKAVKAYFLQLIVYLTKIISLFILNSVQPLNCCPEWTASWWKAKEIEMNTNACCGGGERKKSRRFAVTFSCFYRETYISVFAALQLYTITTTALANVTQGWLILLWEFAFPVLDHSVN